MNTAHKPLAYPVNATREDKRRVDEINKAHYAPFTDNHDTTDKDRKIAELTKLINMIKHFVPEWEFIRLQAKAQEELCK
jgi:hypothetical protein